MQNKVVFIRVKLTKQNQTEITSKNGAKSTEHRNGNNAWKPKVASETNIRYV